MEVLVTIWSITFDVSVLQDLKGRTVKLGSCPVIPTLVLREAHVSMTRALPPFTVFVHTGSQGQDVR